mgnify:FL=1
MEKVRFQVLGYHNFNKKADGKPLTVLTAFYQCTPRDNERGSFGCRCTEFFLPDDKVGTLTPDCIGKEFVPQYGINGFGKPTLEDFSFKEWKA